MAQVATFLLWARDMTPDTTAEQPLTLNADAGSLYLEPGPYEDGLNHYSYKTTRNSEYYRTSWNTNSHNYRYDQDKDYRYNQQS